MRNVTIVESNVEPNKEHLWFYNGRLKWFGPNGWEQVNSQASSPTTTPKPVAPSTTTSTPRPVYSIKFANITDTYIQILGAGYSGDTISPPMQVNQVYILGYIQDDVVVYSLPNQATLQNLKITAYNDGILVEDSVRYEVEATAFGYWYKFSFKKLMEKGVTDVTIEGATSSTTTTSTTPPQPNTTTTTSTRPPNGSGRKITVQPYYGVTSRLSTLMTSKDKLSDIMDMEEKFYPVDTYRYMYYSTSGRYLAVASSSNTENTIVAEISVAADNLNPHTLYPIETSVSGDTGHKFFLFDLSKSPQLESKYDMYAAYVSLCGYTPTTISTIAPFIDGSIPPFADEK